MDLSRLLKKPHLRWRIYGIDKEKAGRLLKWSLVPLAGMTLIYLAAGRYSTVKRMAASKKADVERFLALEEEYLKVKAAYDEVANRAFISGDETVVSVIEGIARSVGAREKITELKPLEEREEFGYTEKTAEARLKGLDLNQLVNLIYRVENHRYLLVVRTFTMKSTFEDPQLYDVSLTISQILKQTP